MTGAALTIALQTQLSAIQAEIALTYGPNYSLSGRAGSESISLADYRAGLFAQQSELIEKLQELQPFQLVQTKRIGGDILNDMRLSGY